MDTIALEALTVADYAFECRSQTGYAVVVVGVDNDAPSAPHRIGRRRSPSTTTGQARCIYRFPIEFRYDVFDRIAEMTSSRSQYLAALNLIT